MATQVSMETALDELSEARSDVESAQKALEDAEASKTQKVTQIKTLMDELKDKAKKLGLEIVADVSEVQMTVQEKLDEAKDDWAQTASTNPNESRRQVRLVWAVLGTVAGLIGGLGIGFIWGRFF